jgi:hypothetical protein
VSAELEAATAAGLLAGDGYALYLQALLEIEKYAGGTNMTRGSACILFCMSIMLGRQPTN